MLRPRLAPILFSRQVQPACICLPSEKWLPDLDSHQDKRLNRPPCYFDTIWQWLVLPAGFPPALVRLEDGRLMCSATAA